MLQYEKASMKEVHKLIDLKRKVKVKRLICDNTKGKFPEYNSDYEDFVNLVIDIYGEMEIEENDIHIKYKKINNEYYFETLGYDEMEEQDMINAWIITI